MKRRKFIKQVSVMSLVPMVGKYAHVAPVSHATNEKNLEPTTVTAQVSAPVNIGSDKQLFIDDQLIAISNGVALTTNPARKTDERNLVADRPWEDVWAGGWNTIIEEEGIYKMWYDAASLTDPDAARSPWSQNPGGRFVCYATSTDGIRWEKPNLGLHTYKGSKQNNILMRETTGAVFIDPKKSDGNKYKYIGWWFGDGKGFDDVRVWVFTSPDGLRWKPMGNRPIMAAKSQYDTQNQIWWDDRLGKYVAYVRHNSHRRHANGQPYTIRQTLRAESSNLLQWPAITHDTPDRRDNLRGRGVVLSPDDADPFVSDHYNICALKYEYAPNVFLGFPSAYLQTNIANDNDGPLDIQLITSRDGIQWNRRDRRPYIGIGVSGNHESGAVYMSLGMLRKGDELWMYYTGYDFTHGDYTLDKPMYKGVVSRVVQRLDGFMSADAAYTGGELRTRPFTFTGSKLILNVDTSAMGSLHAELVDKDAKPIPGFKRSDCDVVNGNFINRTVTWKGKSDLSALKGQPVQLHLLMRSTKLYAFQFAD